MHLKVNVKAKIFLSQKIQSQLQELLHDFHDVFMHNILEGLSPEKFV